MVRHQRLINCFEGTIHFRRCLLFIHPSDSTTVGILYIGCCQAASFWETAAAAVAVAPASGAVVGSSERRAGFG